MRRALLLCLSCPGSRGTHFILYLQYVSSHRHILKNSGYSPHETKMGSSVKIGFTRPTPFVTSLQHVESFFTPCCSSFYCVLDFALRVKVRAEKLHCRILGINTERAKKADVAHRVLK
jgi:hypothetical protein